MAHPPPPSWPANGSNSRTSYNNPSTTWNPVSSSYHGQDSQQELQRQIRQLRLELQAKDDAVFELSATLATVQAETTHRVKTVERDSQSELNKTKEALRRAKLEANVAHASLKKQQQQHVQQQRLLERQRLEEQELIRKHRPPSSSFVTPPTNASIAAKAHTPCTSTTEIKPRETLLEIKQAAVAPSNDDGSGAQQLACRILFAVPQLDKNSMWMDTVNLLHHVQQQEASISEADLVWELVQHTLIACTEESLKEVQRKMLVVLQQALLCSSQGRLALQQACGSKSGDEMAMDQTVSASRKRIRLRSGGGALSPKKRARLEQASQKLSPAASWDRLHSLETSRRLIENLVCFVEHAKEDTDLARESLKIMLVLLSSTEKLLLPWWERISSCSCWSDDGKDCSGCIMSLLREPVVWLSEDGYSQRLLVDMEPSPKGVPHQENYYWDVYAMCIKVMLHLVSRSTTIQGRLWNNHCLLGRRLLALVLDLLEGFALVKMKGAQKLSIMEERLCCELLQFLSIYCQTPQGLLLLRNKMITNNDGRAVSGIAVVVSLLHCSTLVEVNTVAGQAVRLLHAILFRVQQERNKAEETAIVVSFKNLVLEEEEELYKSACHTLLCPDSGVGGDIQTLIRLQLDEIADDQYEEEQLKQAQQAQQA